MSIRCTVVLSLNYEAVFLWSIFYIQWNARFYMNSINFKTLDRGYFGRNKNFNGEDIDIDLNHLTFT